jgi:hypothetical protein
MVEWLMLDPTARRGIVVLARRQVSLVNSATIAVAPRSDRFLRFSRPGVAPVTVSASELLREKPWTIPDPVPGGELFARIAPAPILPSRFLLTGPLAETLEADGELLIRRGLRPGHYEVTPIYEGNVPGRRRAVPIQDGRSTPFYVMPEEVGAATISFGPTVCDGTTVVDVTRHGESKALGGTTSTTERVASISRADIFNCLQRVAGLTPGSYEITSRSTHGVLASGRVSVRSQETSMVELAAATSVRVSGTVELNGRPIEGLSVAFEDMTSALKRVTTVTGADGAYEAVLPGPGSFLVVFRNANGQVMVGSEQELQVVEKLVTANWSLRSASVQIRLTGWNGERLVAIVARPTVMTKPGYVGAQVVLRPGDSQPVAMEGLGVGDYIIEARERGATGEPDRVAGARVTLAENSGTPVVTLNLRGDYGQLTVLLPDGSPSTNATVLVNDSAVMQPVEPGRYYMRNLSPGTQITVLAPGYAPVCRVIANVSSDESITLDLGATARIRFVGRTDISRPVGRFMASGSDCPVSFARLEFQTINIDGDGSAEFAVPNMPQGNRLTFIATPFGDRRQWQTVAWDQDRVVVFHLPPNR